MSRHVSSNPLPDRGPWVRPEFSTPPSAQRHTTLPSVSLTVPGTPSLLRCWGPRVPPTEGRPSGQSTVGRRVFGVELDV